MDEDFIKALNELEDEKGLEPEVVFEALEKALIKAYERNYDDNANVEVTINRETGETLVSALKEVVEEVEDPLREISLEEGRKLSPAISLEEEIAVPVKPKNFGRIAAQTARNIVIQTLRDEERKVIYDELKDREKEAITGNIQRVDNGNYYVDLGRIEGIIPLGEQIPTENLKPGDRVKLFVKEVKEGNKGPQVILSRASEDLVTRMFELEVPEIHDGIVEIYNIAREAGSRSKIAVFSRDEDVDPVGACVGYQGQRIQVIVEELAGEKIDVIIYDKDPVVFLSNSLSPSDVTGVFTNLRERMARIIVPEDQLSLAIGKEGQNVRLAAKLTGWKIDIKGDVNYLEAIEAGELDIEFDGEVEFLESIEADIPEETLEKWEELKSPKKKESLEETEDLEDLEEAKEVSGKSLEELAKELEELQEDEELETEDLEFDLSKGLDSLRELAEELERDEESSD